MTIHFFRQAMTHFSKDNWKKTLIICLCVLTGNALTAFGVAAFTIPHNVLMDGTTGIGIFLNKLFPHYDSAWIILSLNIFLLIFGSAFLGKRFFVTTVAGSILYPLMLKLFQQIPGIERLTPDSTLAAVFGGIIIGVGMGMTLHVGSSTGGMDIVAMLMHRWFNIPVSVGVYALGFFIVGGQAIFYTPDKALLGLLHLIIESFMIEQVILSGKAQVQILAITERYDEVRKLLLNTMNLGITMISIETGYFGKRQFGVLCVLPSRKLRDALNIIKKIDTNSFVTVTKIREVHGRGFLED